ALTVVLALSGTQLVRIAAFSSMGYGAMVAVALAGIGALTLLPAILGMLGTRVNKLRVRKERHSETGGWHRWSMFVMRRPWPALAVGVAIILLLAAPARHLKLGSSGPDILPADAGPRVAAGITADAFGEGQVSPVQIVVTDPRGVTGPGFGELFAFVHTAQRDREVRRVDSIATLVPGQTEQQAQAFAGSPLARDAAGALVGANGTTTLVSVSRRHGAQAPQTDASPGRPAAAA